MNYSTWLPRWIRGSAAEDLERVAPARYLDSSAPPPTILRKQVRPERYLREAREAARLVRSMRGPSAGGSSPAAETGVSSNGRKIKNVVTLDLGTARTNEQLKIDGNIVIYNDSSAGTDRIKLRLAKSDGDQSAPQVTLRPGQEIGGETFRVLLITNVVQAGSTAELWICEDAPPADPLTYQ